MASRQTRVIGGNLTRTQSFELAPGLLQYVQSVLVEVDTTFSGDTTPLLTVKTQDGVPVADKEQGRVLDAGGSGRATWALRLDDETTPATPAAAITEIYSPQDSITVTDPFGPVTAVDVKNRSANITNPGTQSITQGVFTPAVFTQVIWDTGGMANLGVNNDRLTVIESGYYLGVAEAIWFANPDGAYRNTVLQSYTAAGVLQSSWAQSFNNVAGQNTIQNPSGPLRLTAGMYVRLLVFNGSVAARTLGAVYLTLDRLSPL